MGVLLKQKRKQYWYVKMFFVYSYNKYFVHTIHLSTYRPAAKTNFDTDSSKAVTEAALQLKFVATEANSSAAPNIETNVVYPSEHKL